MHVCMMLFCTARYVYIVYIHTSLPLSHCAWSGRSTLFSVEYAASVLSVRLGYGIFNTRRKQSSVHNSLKEKS